MGEIKTQIEQTKRLYIQGKLTPEEVVEFEQYFLDEPELVEQIELEMALKQHLPDVELDAAIAKHQPKKVSWLAKIMDSLRQPIAASMAASVATAIICAVSFSWYWQGKQATPDFTGSGKVNLVYVSPMRSGVLDEQATLSMARGDEQVTLVLQPSDTTASTFNIKMLGPKGKVVQAFNQIDVQGMGDLIIALPMQQLNEGTWTFEIRAVGQTDVVERLVLHVTD